TNAANISSGTLAAARMNPPVSGHTFLGNNTAATAAAAFVQPACGDLSNAASSCSTDTTNAANIASGTLGAARLPALSGDVTSSAGSAVTSLANIPNDVAMAGDILASNTAAPATPAASKTRLYVDSASKVLSSKNDAGTVTHTVASADCSSTGHLQK